MKLPNELEKLIEYFAELPGVGYKTAERFVFFLLKNDKGKLQNFGKTLYNLKDNVVFCNECGQISEQKICPICSNINRDKKIVCVISETADIIPLEKAREFDGVYHVLHGTLNPTEGIMPEKLNIKKLLERINKNQIKEVVFALNPTIEGETTTLYLTNLLKKYNIKTTKLARGLPQGSDLEYADEITLSNAIKGRTEI